ncbi:hypothetical protein EVAR_47677_1 [Eumeta japonica]|uniref:Uncharacterized protein n=1 Tax=Eumeta variegata TaxID=151549 RepID=A0A4C1XXH5_EUMVA|nr:hypothetical protein EVAR_47677_1 [Eumeta japonica]
MDHYQHQELDRNRGRDRYWDRRRVGNSNQKQARDRQLASRWHWLYRRYCACVIPLFAPQSDDSCLLRVSALGHLLFVFTSWYDSMKLARIETSCSEIGRIHRGIVHKTISYRAERAPISATITYLAINTSHAGAARAAPRVNC